MLWFLYCDHLIIVQRGEENKLQTFLHGSRLNLFQSNSTISSEVNIDLAVTATVTFTWSVGRWVIGEELAFMISIWKEMMIDDFHVTSFWGLDRYEASSEFIVLADSVENSCFADSDFNHKSTAIAEIIKE